LPRAILTLLALVGPGCISLIAQTGVVRSGGQAIPGATVTATLKDQTVSTVTGVDGSYRFASLAEGAWTLEVKMFGFAPARQTVVSGASKPVDFNIQLSESPAARRLVQAAAGRAGGAAQPANEMESQLQTDLNSGQAPQVAAPPAMGQDSSNESFLVSGSLSQGLAPNAPPDFGGDFMQRGGPPGGDGNNVPGQGPGAGRGGGGPGGFGGGGGPGGGFGGPGGGGRGGPGGGGPGGDRGMRERGARPGGAQFGNRRRPNGIHGMVSFTLNNSALNAKPFSISGLNATQPAYAQGRFSVIAGGPLVLPKLVKDAGTFFSFNYFATRARNPYTAFATVPTQAERQGDFTQAVQSAGPISIYDPTTHLPFQNNNVIPDNRISPIARSLLKYVPLPNSPGAVNNYAFYASVPQNTDNVGVRLQRSVTKADRLSFGLNVQRRDGNTAQPFAFIDTGSGFGLNANLQWTHNFSTHLISNARVAFNRNRSTTTPFFAFGADVASQDGIAGTSSNPINFGPPNLNFTNFGALRDANASLTRNQSQTFGENIIFIRGRHSFTFGIEYRRSDLSTRTDPNGRGTFNFTGLATSAFEARGPVPNTGYDFADYLLGLPQSSSIRYGDSSTYFAQNVWTGFVNDDFKVHPRLTLNLGVRYEYFSPLAEKYGRAANLDIAPGYTAVAVVVPGQVGPYTGTFPGGLINPQYKNISPRLALAWKVPHIKRSTILRAGYGIYYNGQAYNGLGSKLAQQPPFAISNSINTSPQNVLTLAQGFVATSPADVTNTYAVDRFFRTPYAQTWNLQIQHDLPKGFFIELGYLGTKGTHLDVLTLPNQGPPGSQRKNQLGNAVGFTFDSSNGNSIYHALQVRAQRRFRGGISMTAFYTFSKSIDDSSTFGGAGNTVAQNWLDLSAERGLSSFDRRHSFDMNFILTSPVGGPKSHFAPGSWTARLLKDWTLNGAMNAQSGTPLTARVLGNSAQLAQTSGTGSGRANATGVSLASDTGFFNPAAFTVPPLGQFGNAGRNTIPGPDLFSVNMGFGRAFAFDESRRRFEVRMEANNVFNHVNYTNVNTVVNAINAGTPISAASMRTVGITARFRF
jgi:hypothetical protein